MADVSSWLVRPSAKVVTAVVAVLLLVSAAVLFLDGPEHKKVSAEFDRAVSIFPGTEVRVMGVTIGEVTSVVPQGRSVKVEMEYDAEYQVPADVKAVIITPTLVADRFVQLTPVWTSGPTMADGGTIPLAETGTPVELDRIYSSLSDLSQALGPNGANADGSLNRLLKAGAGALDGNGKRANQMLLDMSRAAETFGNNSGTLFETVEQLNSFTQTLAENDKVVDSFMSDLGTASRQLAGEKEEIAAALEALARAVGTVKTFVRENRDLATDQVKNLNVALQALVDEKESLTTAMEKGPLGASNLALAFDVKTGSVGARINVGPNVEDLDGFLCTLVKNAQVPAAQTACQVFKQLVEPLGLGLGQIVGMTGNMPDSRLPGEAEPAGDLDQLLGGGQR